MFKISLNDNDYFYQIGDDIKLLDKNWSWYFCQKLIDNGNIGVVCPHDLNNKFILTQSFVHKTHYEIFNFYFPLSIKNLYCDTWIENIYKKNVLENIIYKNYMFKFIDISVRNCGGDPRYYTSKRINKKSYQNYLQELKDHKNKITNYINCKK